MKRILILSGALIMLLTGIFMIFLTGNEHGAMKAIGAIEGMIGILILAHPRDVKRKERPSLHSQIKEWGIANGYISTFTDEETIMLRNRNRGILLRFDSRHQKLTINADGGKRVVFNGRIHTLGQLEHLLEIIH